MKNKYSDIDIIYFTLFPYDHAYSSVSLSFTREFVKNNRVFYVNHPYTWKDFTRQLRSPNQSEVFQARKQNLWKGRATFETIKEINTPAVQPPNTFPINFLPDGSLYKLFYKYNNRLVLNTIKKIIEKNNIKKYIYFNCFNPYYAPVLPRPEFSPLLNIYQCIDDMTEEEYTAKHGARLEQQAIADADLAVVTSTNLYKLKQHLQPNLHILNNAVDHTIFEPAVKQKLSPPKELQGIKGKIIGFAGNINEYRLDYSLFKSIAEYHKDKTLVMVGPLNSENYKDYGLDRMPNVVLTGGKHISELPAFLQHFDCTVIPFQKNKLTQSVYPLKINEYLTAGKAVISTDFSADIQSFADVIYLASDHDTFLKKIDQAIDENNAQRIQARLDVAAINTWAARVAEFWDIVGQQLKKNE